MTTSGADATMLIPDNSERLCEFKEKSLVSVSHWVLQSVVQEIEPVP